MSFVGCRTSSAVRSEGFHLPEAAFDLSRRRTICDGMHGLREWTIRKRKAAAAIETSGEWI
jgi:hypothetical protein